jgi:hypothetical protein
MGKVWVLHTETKGTGAEMVPLEKVLEEPSPPRAPVVAPKRHTRIKPSAPQRPWQFKVVDVMTRQVLAEGVDARTTVDLLKNFRSVVDVSVYAWDETVANWRVLTLGERRTLWSFRDRSG